MMGSSMMGQGRGGMMGMAAPLAEDLSAGGVRHNMEHRVAQTSNPNLKVGDIVEKDDDTVTADVVTKDGSLVVRYMVDRHAGMMRAADMDDSMKNERTDMITLRRWWGLAAGFALVSAPAMALAQQDRPYYGDHMWGSGWGGWFFGPLMMIFWLVLLVGAVILVLRWLGVTETLGRRSGKPGPDAMDLLRERFAKGEIDKAEFEERRALLER